MAEEETTTIDFHLGNASLTVTAPDPQSAKDVFERVWLNRLGEQRQGNALEIQSLEAEIEEEW